MQMQRLAFGAKCGGRGASGLAGSSAASRPFSCSSEATASRPTPLALVARKLRRDCRRLWCRGCMAGSPQRSGRRELLETVLEGRFKAAVVVLVLAEFHLGAGGAVAGAPGGELVRVNAAGPDLQLGGQGADPLAVAGQVADHVVVVELLVDPGDAAVGNFLDVAGGLGAGEQGRLAHAEGPLHGKVADVVAEQGRRQGRVGRS